MRNRVALAVSAAIAFALAAAVARGPVAAWERSIARALVSLPDAIRPGVWLVMQAGTRAALVVAVAALFLAKKRRAAAIAGISGAAAWVIAVVAKETVARPRPTAAAVGRTLREQVDGHGFPSSHTAIAAALAAAIVLSLRPPPRYSAVLVCAAVAVGLARIYFGVHWPLDVAGGAAIGVFTGAIASSAVAAR